MKIQVPEHVKQSLQTYADRVFNFPDAYIKEHRDSENDPFDPSLPGVAKKFIEEKDKQDVYWNNRLLQTNDAAKMYVLYRPGASVRNAIVEWLDQHMPQQYMFSHISGFFWYPPTGFMGWHTNSNTVGIRTYLVYADEDQKSFFRYYDKQTDQIITDWDQKGWNARSFMISNDPTEYYWHCVYSDCNRISIGINYAVST